VEREPRSEITELADKYRWRAESFAALIDATAPGRWSDPSPCEGWSARDVVAHVVDFQAHVLREKAGVSRPPVFADFNDPAAAFRSSSEAVQRVLDDPATTVDLANYLDGALSFDLPQHGWDLAKATGQDATMDPQEIGLLWSTLTQQPRLWEWQRENGWYATPVRVPENASLQDRVLGLLGRDPTWTPSG
jgi:uncharacterized protein (TIGR03086 family)